MCLAQVEWAHLVVLKLAEVTVLDIQHSLEPSLAVVGCPDQEVALLLAGMPCG